MAQLFLIGLLSIHHLRMLKISFTFDEITKVVSNISVTQTERTTTKVIRSTTGKATVEVTDNKLIISDPALALLGANPGDRISINYYQESKEVKLPLISLSENFSDRLAGNKLTKSNTVSFRGNQRTILLEYGTVFELKEFKDSIYKLVPLNDSSSEIVKEELLDEETALEEIADTAIFDSTLSEDEDSLPF